MKISRRAYLAAAAAVIASTAGTMSAQAQTKWNLPAAYPATNYHTENLIWFAEEVKKATGGKLDITVHPGASLFKTPEINARCNRAGADGRGFDFDR